MTRVILLGAGASYGSIDVSPSVPPLGSSLFDALASRDTQAATLPDDLKNLFRENFEVGMAAFYKYSNGTVMRFQRELAHFIAEFIPGPANEYIRLINSLPSARCVLSTLNYDLLIEMSAGHLGYNTTYSIERSPKCIRLLKLHGSCNFWPHMPGMTLRGVVISNCGTDIQAEIRPISREETLRKCITEDSVAPSIAMYAEGKPVKVSPDYVERQKRMWSQAVSQSSKICIAGARVHVPDTHIWGPLSTTKADVFYYGRQADYEAFGQWKEATKKANAHFIEADFSAAIPQISKIMTRI